MITDKSSNRWAEFSVLPPPSICLRRFDDGRGSRFYYYLGYEDGNVVAKTAIGITSLLSMVLPTSSFLTDWKIQNTNYEELLEASSSYGTLFHLAAGSWITERKIDPEVINAARTIAINNGQSFNMIEKDILSFMKFVEDYEVNALLVEAMLLKDDCAQTIDLLAEVTVEEVAVELVEDGVWQRGEKKGQPKIVENKVKSRVKKIALIDLKSNFFE